jgi:hypothetical protein
VAGAAASFFDPQDEEAMAACIETAFAGSTSNTGPERARNFSWRRCAKETLDVLQSVAL